MIAIAEVKGVLAQADPHYEPESKGAPAAQPGEVGA